MWSLYCKTDRGQYDGLSIGEARAIVMVLSPEVRPHWLAYRAGWKTWRPLKDCATLLTSGGMSRTRIRYRPPKIDSAEKLRETVPHTGIFETTATGAPGLEVEEDFSHFETWAEVTRESFPHDFSVAEAPTAITDNRRNKRYPLRLHVALVCKDKVYETFSKDISLGGIAVHGCLPEWVAGYGTLILSTVDMKHRLEFMCSVVENQKGRNYRLELYSSPHTKKLKEWLEVGLPESTGSAKNLRKKAG